MYLQCQNFRYALNPVMKGDDYIILCEDNIVRGYFKNMSFKDFKDILNKYNALKIKGALEHLPSIINGVYGLYKSVELKQVDALPVDWVDTEHYCNEPFGKIFRMQISSLGAGISTLLKRRITLAQKKDQDWIFVGDLTKRQYKDHTVGNG